MQNVSLCICIPYLIYYTVACIQRVSYNKFPFFGGEGIGALIGHTYFNVFLWCTTLFTIINKSAYDTIIVTSCTIYYETRGVITLLETFHK